ncbi:3(2),5-bisphosphate nucleotidase HAL2 [Terfezia boudieri ATCC MYA-4762]|uniref:3'(2'),5'-bisphosphate nucleotidase n=1 Tax=Terfezia boudieri ATCC MYA-4762 TaxID=1051890 RepID=A0A3N4L6G8_9PEZI|nr:3(2),5-bisphosphate nucleotidase HAL2 [Terfezia boudieri ATCC MYA-4762]
MSTSPYACERRIAELAVQRAALLTDRIYNSQVKGTTIKEDKSPVTLADLGGQALVIAALRHAFPDDFIVGEEDSEILRKEDDKRNLLWSHIKEVLDEGLVPEAEIGTIRGEVDMMNLIDRGNHGGGRTGRIWALDPVDGTLGFLRGGQYAVALGLMVDAQVQVGAMACPNLPVELSKPDGAKGILLSAERGQGATERPSDPTSTTPAKPIHMNPISSAAEGSFCESVEASHSRHDMQANIATKLGITKPSVRMDSQAKYASIARGDGDLYLRMPSSSTYEEKIWDHAAGSIIVEEAGGVVTDASGKPLDFGTGKTLKANKGIIATPASVHAEVIKAVKEELEKPDL